MGMGHLWDATHFRSVLARHHRRGYARTGFQTAGGYRVGRKGSPVRPTGEAGSGDGYRVGGIPQDRRTPGRVGDETPPRGWFPKWTSTRAGELGGDPQSLPPRPGPTAPPGTAGRGAAHQTWSGRPPANPTGPSVAPASTPRRTTGDRTTGTRATSSGDRRSGSGGFAAFCSRDARSRPVRESTFAEPISKAVCPVITSRPGFGGPQRDWSTRPSWCCLDESPLQEDRHTPVWTRVSTIPGIEASKGLSVCKSSPSSTHF